MAAENKYQSLDLDVVLGDPFPEEKQRKLDNSLKYSVESDPNRWANIDALNRKTGVPHDTIERNFTRVSADNKYKNIDLNKILADSPKTADWLSNPYNARQAHDDIEKLSKLERITSSFGRGVDQMQGMMYSSAEAFGEAVDSEAITEFGKAGREENIRQASQYGMRQQFLEITDANDFTNWLAEGLSEQLPMMAPSLAGGLGGAAAGSAFGPVGTVAGGVAGAFFPSLVLGVGETQMAIKEKAPEVEAPGVAFAAGGAIAALDSVLPGKVGSRLAKSFGFDPASQIAEEVVSATLTQAAKKIAAQTVKGATTEGITESLQEAISEVSASYAVGQDVNVPDLVRQMIEAGVLGAVMGGGVAGSAEVISQYKTARDQQRLNGIAENRKGNKLADNNPEALRELFRLYSDTVAVYIDPNTAQVFFQQGKIPPELEGNATLQKIKDDIPKAIHEGRDIEISVSDYATDIAGTSVHENLAWGMHMDPMTLSPQEQEQLAQIKAETDPDSRPAEQNQIFSDAYGQVLSSGYNESAAETHAIAATAFFETLGQRVQEKAIDIYKKINPTIGRQIDPRLKQRLEAVSQFDVALNKVRSGKIPTEQEAFGPSIIDFITEKGGIKDEGGELAAMDADVGRVGKNRLTREDGRTLDDIAEVLVEEGYIQERSENAVVNAIQKELSGMPVYSPKNENIKAANERQSLDELEAAITEANINLDEMTNAEVQKILLGEPSPDVLRQFQAAAGPAPVAEQQDFGDIKLTEELTTPLGKRTRTMSAQKEFDKNMARRNVLQQIKDCLNAA